MPEADGSGLSIWDDFSRRKGKIKNSHTNHIGCNFYTHYNEDIEIIKKLEIPNFRFSIA
jgi:beta-glucosidase